MNKIATCFLSVLTLTLASKTFSEDLYKIQEMSDDDMREVNGKIIAPTNSSANERELILKLKDQDPETLLMVKIINRTITDAQTGKITSENMDVTISRFMQGLLNMGVPNSVINQQINILLAAQDRAIADAAKLAAQQAIFQQFLNGLQTLGQQFQHLQVGQSMTVNLGNLFGSFYAIPEIQAEINRNIPGGMGSIQLINITIQK